MKGEGRQHGMVIAHYVLPCQWNPRTGPHARNVNELHSPPAAGLFTKVQPKPTNHSKFTGKCGKPRCSDCHMYLRCKSRDKIKRSRKLRSNDVVSNYRLVSWRIVDHRPSLKSTGFSVTGILDLLADDYLDDDDQIDDSLDDDQYCPDDLITNFESSSLEQIQTIGEDDDHISFCDVGFLLNHVDGDEGWCFVADM